MDDGTKVVGDWSGNGRERLVLRGAGILFRTPSGLFADFGVAVFCFWC